MKTCLICGNQIADNETTCSRCGYSVNQSLTSTSDSPLEATESAHFEIEPTQPEKESENSTENNMSQTPSDAKDASAKQDNATHPVLKNETTSKNRNVLIMIVAIAVVAIIAFVALSKKNTTDDKNSSENSSKKNEVISSNPFDESAIKMAQAIVTYDYDTFSTLYAFDFDDALTESSSGNISDGASYFESLKTDFESTYGTDYTIEATIKNSTELSKTDYTSVVNENDDIFLSSLAELDLDFTAEDVYSLAKVTVSLSISGSEESDTSSLDVYLVKLNPSASWSTLLVHEN